MDQGQAHSHPALSSSSRKLGVSLWPLPLGSVSAMWSSHRSFKAFTQSALGKEKRMVHIPFTELTQMGPLKLLLSLQDHLHAILSTLPILRQTHPCTQGCLPSPCGLPPRSAPGAASLCSSLCHALSALPDHGCQAFFLP